MSAKGKFAVTLGLGFLLLILVIAIACGPEQAEIQPMGVTNLDSLHLSDTGGTETPALRVNQDGEGRIVEVLDASTPVWAINDGGSVSQSGGADFDSTLNVDGATTLNGNVSLNDAITDNTYVYGQMRTYDGTDNWADISSVSALGRGNGWHAAYKILGWGTGTQFQALFANAQVSATMATTNTIHGAELKATASNGNNHLGTAIGAYGKLTIKDTGSQLAAGYPFYSIIDVNNSGVITDSASYYAELSGETTLGTVSVLKTKSGDTWDYGLDFNGATLTNDIVGQNAETITNSPNGEWDFGSANLDTSGTVQFSSSSFYPIGYNTADYAIDFGTDTVTDTLSLSLTNVTTPTVGFCTLGEDVDANEAICSLGISGTSATLKLWNAAGDSAGSTGTSVHWMIIGQD